MCCQVERKRSFVDTLVKALRLRVDWMYRLFPIIFSYSILKTSLHLAFDRACELGHKCPLD